jgi:hypothetical protein
MARSLAKNDFDRRVPDKLHAALLKEFKLSQNRLKADDIEEAIRACGLWRSNPATQVIPALSTVSTDCPASSAVVWRNCSRAIGHSNKYWERGGTSQSAF